MNPKFPFIFSLLILIAFGSNAQSSTTDSTKLLEDTATHIFEKVDIEASFAGGDQAWRRFLEKNLNASVAADNGAPVGMYTVVVQFIVDKEGNITDVKALTNNGYGMEGEVVRLIKKGPQWKPASQGGRVVKAYRKQPVTFMIEDDSFNISSKTPFVFYVGTDNLISVTADKVKSEDLEITISQGSIISNGDGNYIVRVNKTGRVILQLFNKKKKNKEIGSASFEVKKQS